METFFLRCFVVVAVAGGLLGCQSSATGDGGASRFVPVLSPDMAHAAGFSPQQVSEASALCATKCAKCHKFYDPTDYAQNEWDMWMRKMSRKSKLKPAQEELLTRYLNEFRKKR